MPGFVMPGKKYVDLPNGETYAYLEQGKLRSSGKTILLIHGNFSSSLYFLPLFRRLSGVHLVAPDQRGCGDSSYNKHFSTLLELAQDIKLFADALGIAKAHVVGWSTGGGIAFELAAKYPEFVTSLFIIQGASCKGFPLFKRTSEGAFTPFASKDELCCDSVLIGSILAAYEKKDASYINALWKAIYQKRKPSVKDNELYISETLKQRNLVDLDWALMHFNMSNEYNGYSQGTEEIGRIKCPAVFTCAELDKVVPVAAARENAAAVSGSQVLEYKKCGHSPLVDCPGRLAADILAQMGNQEVLFKEPKL